MPLNIKRKKSFTYQMCPNEIKHIKLYLNRKLEELWLSKKAIIFTIYKKLNRINL